MLKELISEQKIITRVQNLANQISQDYQGKELVIIFVTTGSYMFTSDLTKKLTLPEKNLIITSVGVSSYGKEMTSTGEPLWTQTLSEEIKDKHVLIIEDIVDEGHTIELIKTELSKKNPASLEICTFLFKKEKYKKNIPLKYIGYVCADLFVVGYGLDYAGKYRQLPYIGIIDEKNEVKDLISKYHLP